ncbi:MAG: hypothetical protein J5903_03485, partial [Clostridia bacterium]|nr:hypothetical protein [Clostridia bacterium]
MKKTLKAFAFICAALIATICVLTGCDITRKLNGAETTFPQKVSSADTLSFKMKLNYKKGETNNAINMECYKMNAEDGKEEYAYIYDSSQSLYHSYKNVYADNKLYETVNVTANSGSYYVKNDVNIDD